MASRGAYGKGYQRGYDAGKQQGFDTGKQQGFSAGKSDTLFISILSSVVTGFFGIILGNIAKKKK